MSNFSPTISFSVNKSLLNKIDTFLRRHENPILVLGLSIFSIICFIIFYQNHLGLAYNDARSHLDIGRRVVDGLKPGLAQLGSVWLPLPHMLMIPLIWNDFMWHSGLAGAYQSMISFVLTGLVINLFLKQLKVGVVGRITGIAIFVLNFNILYLQSTAMTELLLIATMTLGVYELLMFHKTGSIYLLVRSSFWIMLSTLVRYDGWFLFGYSAILIALYALRKKGVMKGLKMGEGLFILFSTVAGFGIFMWFVWNAVIFKDPLYFILGPYSAHAQQDQLADAGVLATKHNMVLSLQTYGYSMAYNTGVVVLIVGFIGALVLFLDKKIDVDSRIAISALLAPLVFNIIALYFGFSVLFIQGINGNTWFNVRYGVMMMPSIAIFIGYLVGKMKPARWVLIGILAIVLLFSFLSYDAVTIDDGRVGSSQKNVTEVSGWLTQHVSGEPGFVLISAASHDAIIFSSGLPMTRFIHEGTGSYWLNATTSPDRWARWIVMRTNDPNDQTFRLVSKSGQLNKYTLMESYPFADVYELKPQFFPNLNTHASLGPQK